MPRQLAGRDQDRVEADVADRRQGLAASQISAAAAMRCFCRSLTDSAAASSVARAFTSTKISVWRRAAMMSISPSGLFQRRAKMR